METNVAKWSISDWADDTADYHEKHRCTYLAKNCNKNKISESCEVSVDASQFGLYNKRNSFTIYIQRRLGKQCLPNSKTCLERHFYEIEAARNDGSLTEFKRQFDTSLYERLARDKEDVKRLSTHGRVIGEPSGLRKEPYVLEFLGYWKWCNIQKQSCKSILLIICNNFLLNWVKALFLSADSYCRNNSTGR